MSATQTLDVEKAQQLGMKLIGDTTGGLMGVLMVVGDRLGLFDVLAAAGPLTSSGFAGRAGIAERYAREWLSAMACQGYVAYDGATGTFSLTPEQVFCLVNQDSPLYLTSIFGVLPDYWRNVDLLTDAFRHGGGVPQERFGDDWLCGFQRFSRTAFVNYLCQDWLPAMPDIEARLLTGGSMADIGCGNGMALVQVARGYPAARLVGFDHHAPAIEAARANAVAAGVGDRIRFEVLDAGRGIPGTYDLITCFDVVHDMPFPRQALPQIRAALAPGGSFFVLEFNFSDELQANIDHPFGLGSFGYAASVNYCMTTALAVGGEGTGTCMGERRLRAFAAEAGFSEVRRLDFSQNPLNLIFEIKP
ncbi:MAG TPA: class I SAM-dependent methyltransferase [Thermomicrobiales bacterium]